MEKAEAHFTPAGRGRAPNSFKNRQANKQPSEPRRGKDGEIPEIECFNCHKKGHFFIRA